MKNPLSADLDFILQHTVEAWQELAGHRIFITGGTGFFGCWLLESLAWANDHLNLQLQATVLSRNPGQFTSRVPHLAQHPAIHWCQGDVKDFTFPAGEYRYVIHAASEGDPRVFAENPLLVFDTIVEGTRRVLEFARTHGTRKLLFTSSGAVYGPQPPEITHLPEDYPGAPLLHLPASAYGEGKRAAEMLCALSARSSALEVKIARCFAFVGPYLPLDANFAVGNFIRDALRGGPIVIKGDGSPYRSYLYAADLAIWLWTILVRGSAGRAYNVGSDQEINIRDLAERVRQVVNSEIQIEQQQTPIPGAPVARYVPSVLRIKEELGLSEWITLDAGIQKCWQWHLASVYRKRVA